VSTTRPRAATGSSSTGRLIAVEDQNTLAGQPLVSRSTTTGGSAGFPSGPKISERSYIFIVMSVNGDGRRARGDRTRDRVLESAVGLATERGLDGFTLGELAAECGVAKASIAAAFGDKSDLQRAIVGRAQDILRQRLFGPVALAADGITRLERLGTVWFDYLSDPALRGGCFFAAALFEFDARPGALQTLVSADINRWIAAIESMIEHGQKVREIDPAVDAGDEALEFFTLGVTTNALIQLGRHNDPAARARRAWTNHIDRIRTPGAARWPTNQPNDSTTSTYTISPSTTTRNASTLPDPDRR
jgi:AcrR family transcriptional regulator